MSHPGHTDPVTSARSPILTTIWTATVSSSDQHPTLPLLSTFTRPLGHFPPSEGPLHPLPPPCRQLVNLRIAGKAPLSIADVAAHHLELNAIFNVFLFSSCPWTTTTRRSSTAPAAKNDHATGMSLPCLHSLLVKS
ncbi:hypothetical protein AAC387_Pa03g1694 [Persea americana]